MASRTKQKEEARARRLAEEQARSERERRDRRLRMVGGVVLAAIAVVAVLVAVSSGGGNKAAPKPTSAAAKSSAASVKSLLAGIPQSGARLGNPKAPVTMTYFGDLECPVCQAFTLGNDGGGWPKLVSNEVRQGKVQVVYKAFETATHDPTVFKTQQVAALAAGMQNKFWNFAELFYHEQGTEDTNYVTESYLQGLATQIPGLNLTKWEADRNAGSLGTQVLADGQAGTTLGVTGTPTLVFKGPTGKQSSPSASIPSYSDLQQAIKQVS
jgi:protein-disulfide isomerase